MFRRSGTLLLLLSCASCGGPGAPRRDEVPALPVTPTVRRWRDVGQLPDESAEDGRRLRLGWEVTVPALPDGTGELCLWIPAPRHERPIQAVIRAELGAPAGASAEEYWDIGLENRYWFVSIPSPRPPVRIQAMAVVERWARESSDLAAAGTAPPTERQRTLTARFLRGSEGVPVTGRARGLAQSIAPDETNGVVLARALFDHVRERYALRETDGDELQGETLRALDAGFGDSSDLASVFISLARSRGVPARFVSGLALPAERAAGTVLRPCFWAEFFVPELGWVPLDVAAARRQPARADAFFGRLLADRITLVLGRDLLLRPPPAAGTLRFLARPHAEADGVAVAATMTVRAEDL